MAEAEGEDRAMRAAQEALDSPLLNDNDIKGARFVLFNITYGGREILMDEITEITEHIQEAAGSSADVIWGYGRDESLGEKIRITLIATGFQTNPNAVDAVPAQASRTVIPLMEETATPVTQPIANPVGGTWAPAAPVAPPVAQGQEEPYIKVVANTPAAPALPQQSTIEFAVERNVARTAAETPTPAPEIVKTVFTLYDETNEPNTVAGAAQTEVTEARLSAPEHHARVEERQARMRDLSTRLRTTNGLADLEREPAYKRKNLQLNDAPHSTESTVSRYTLNEEVDETGERRVELRRNNPYLHDNVD